MSLTLHMHSPSSPSLAPAFPPCAAPLIHTWSGVYGAWPSDQPRQAAATLTCPDGLVATSFAITRLGHSNGWAGGENWVGTLGMVCNNGQVLGLDTQPANTAKPTALIATSSTGECCRRQA